MITASRAAEELRAGFSGAGVSVQPAGAHFLPVVARPLTSSLDVFDWVAANRPALDAVLRQVGGILFRGFDTGTIGGFARLSDLFIDTYMDYGFVLTPRQRITDTIATATEFPPHMTIPLHGECAAQRDWPMTIAFWCEEPPATGGETPLADNRKVHDRLPGAIRDRFVALGLRYVRHIRGRRDIERVFGTANRSRIAEYCEQNGYAVAFDGGDHVRTERVSPAIQDHPVTGDRVWFNHFETYHLSSLPIAMVKRNFSFDGNAPPLELYYGDGAPIEKDVARQIRLALRAETVTFVWERGDVLVLDNMLVAHGRRPYTGPRRVLVSMGNAYLGMRARHESLRRAPAPPSAVARGL